MIGLIFTTEEEALPFLQQYQRGRFDGLTEGETVEDDQLLVSLMGVGKIKATLRTERLLRQVRPDRLLHVGTCTGLNEKHAVGTMVGVSQVFEGDRIELAAPTYPRMPLTVPFEGLSEAVLVTQDHLVKGAQEQSYWQRIADVSDMAGYAVAYVAATYGVPCHIAKVVAGRFGTPDDALRKTRESSYGQLASFLLGGALEALTEAEA